MKKRMEQARKLARCVAELCSLCLFTPLGRLLRLVSPAYKRVWLIAERGHEARDNAWHLFRYITREHPEIHAWFMIDKDSPDVDRVAAAGRVVLRNGVRHRLLMGAAERLVSTHIMGYTPDIGAYFRLDRLRLVPGIKVFLQHGITKDDMPFMHYPRTRCDLFVCAAKGEYEYISERFGHQKDVPQLVGFCRYDALMDSDVPRKRQILLMPTWREWIALHDAGDFTQSDYYKAIDGLINSPRLASLLEQYDYDLAFYPHYEMHRFLHLFKSSCPRVRILGFKGNDVQRLLIESSLLITDFSSVFFDFAYMEKPEVFYQFDEAEFRRRQYQEGYFSYRRDAFGSVCATLTETLDAVEGVLRRECAIEPEYRQRIAEFFTLRDNQNCRRNYEAILALDSHRE